MAFAVKKLFQNRYNDTSEHTVYTVGTGLTAIVKDLVICNTTAGAATISISIVPSGGSASDDNRILAAYSVAANDTKVISLSTTMTAGDFISIKEGTANAISVTGSGVEFDTTGRIASATVTANQTTITSEVDLTSLTVTATLSSSRRYKISFVGEAQTATSGDEVTMRIKEGSTTLKEIRNSTLGANRGHFFEGWYELVAPSSGSHTYKMTMQRTAGSSNAQFNASSTNPATILLEDIGAA